MVVKANLGLSVYLLLYVDRSFEGFWIKMQVEEMHRILFPNYQKGICCYTVLVGSIGDKRSQLCIDSCCKQISSWRKS